MNEKILELLLKLGILSYSQVEEIKKNCLLKPMF